MLDGLVKARGWSPREIGQLFVSIGPGSFTGLRIGVTLAKTFAFATGARVVAVPSLDVLVRNVPDEWRHAIVLLDAKRGQIFAARYANQEGRFVEEEPAHLDTLEAMLTRAPRPVHLIGEGLQFHQPSESPADSDVIVTSSEAWQARASVVGRLGLERAARGEFTEPQRLVPLYIRLPEAEEKRLAGEAEGRARQ